MKAFFQRLGRSIMLPVAVLPAAAILAGIGNWILGFSADNLVGTFLLGAGTSILNNLAIIFAVGIAIGLSKDGHGAAALSGLTGFRSEEHTSELQSRFDLVCRLLLEKKK